MPFLIRYFLLIGLIFTFTLSLSQNSLLVLPSQESKIVISAIKEAKKNIYLTMYGFTDKKIADLLIEKQKNGVKVQLLIEKNPYKANGENRKILKKLKQAGIEIHYPSEDFAFLHQKTIVIDNNRAFILTGNFTYSGLYKQRNFILETKNKDIVAELTHLFNADWTKKKYLPNKQSTIILSPEMTWPKLNRFIKNSQQELNIYAAALSDKRIVQALIRQDIDIKIIISPETKIFNLNGLCKHQIHIHYLEKYQQHAKCLMRDYQTNNRLAYVGSANLSYSGLSKNRELGIFFSNPEATEKLHKTFEQDWTNSKALCN